MAVLHRTLVLLASGFLQEGERYLIILVRTARAMAPSRLEGRACRLERARYPFSSLSRARNGADLFPLFSLSLKRPVTCRKTENIARTAQAWETTTYQKTENIARTGLRSGMTREREVEANRARCSHCFRYVTFHRR